jgi:hypothetical protein
MEKSLTTAEIPEWASEFLKVMTINTNESISVLSTDMKSINDSIRPLLEKHDESIDNLFQLNDENKKKLVNLGLFVGQHTSEIDALKTSLQALQTELDALKTRQNLAEEKSELIQSTQHDDYDKAFKKEDFLDVFLFLITHGYNTCLGLTCVVFHEINNALCVCINIRALSLIAKLKLNYSQIAKLERFPSFGLFKVNSLRQLFRDAKLPQMDMEKSDVDVVSKHLAMRPLKTPAGNKSSWIALDADPFVFAIQNLKRAKKIAPFCDLFQKYYPKSVKFKKITEKDMCFFLNCDDQPTLPKQPLFQMQYWKELFYPSMKEYRKRLIEAESKESEEQEPILSHTHFLSLCVVDAEEDIICRDVLMQTQGKQPQEPAQTTLSKRTRDELEEDEEDEEDDFVEGVPQKRPRACWKRLANTN